MAHWLLKSEPSEFSFDDLWAAKGRKSAWTGIRNHQARNLIRDQMRAGDEVLFYHSSADPTAVVGLARVTSAPYPDPTQFEPRDERYDPKARRDAPTWFAVNVQAVRKLERAVTLEELKGNPKLAKMGVVQRGNRLSVQPVAAREFEEVVRMAALPA